MYNVIVPHINSIYVLFLRLKADLCISCEFNVIILYTTLNMNGRVRDSVSVCMSIYANI